MERLLYDNHTPKAVVTLAERFMRLVPDMRGYWWRGMAREDLGETDGALADIERTAELAPRFGYAFKRIARLRLAHGEGAWPARRSPRPRPSSPRTRRLRIWRPG